MGMVEHLPWIICELIENKNKNSMKIQRKRKRKTISGVAGKVVCHEQEDLAVWNSQPLHCPVKREHVGTVPIVEPES